MYEPAPRWAEIAVGILAVIVLAASIWVFFIYTPQKQAEIKKNEAYIESLNLGETK